MPRIIAFFNQKGGTAKTTSTLNVAAALAERGVRVLTMDLDPQASLTMAFGVDVASLELSVYDLFLDDDLPIADIIVPTTIDGVHLVPSHPDFATAEMARLKVPFFPNTIGLFWAGPLILAIGTEEQKRRYIPGILSGDDIWCQGFSEPDQGSDLANAQTKACLLYTSPSPRDRTRSRMPSSACKKKKHNNLLNSMRPSRHFTE